MQPALYPVCTGGKCSKWRDRAFRPSAGLPEKQLSRALFRLIHHQGADGFSPTGTGN